MSFISYRAKACFGCDLSIPLAAATSKQWSIDHKCIGCRDADGFIKSCDRFRPSLRSRPEPRIGDGDAAKETPASARRLRMRRAALAVFEGVTAAAVEALIKLNWYLTALVASALLCVEVKVMEIYGRALQGKIYAYRSVQRVIWATQNVEFAGALETRAFNDIN